MASDSVDSSRIHWRVAFSTGANVAGQVVTLLVGFFLTPFVLHHLGTQEYGLWVLVGLDRRETAL